MSMFRMYSYEGGAHSSNTLVFSVRIFRFCNRKKGLTVTEIFHLHVKVAEVCTVGYSEFTVRYICMVSALNVLLVLLQYPTVV